VPDEEWASQNNTTKQAKSKKRRLGDGVDREFVSVRGFNGDTGHGLSGRGIYDCEDERIAENSVEKSNIAGGHS
jgi:hypothetical protein